MADSADMNALAKRYIELWQDQMAQISTDPSVTEAWRNVFENAAKNLGMTPDAIAAYTAAFSGAARGTAGDRSESPGATSAATASGHGGADLANVLRRLDALERRLAALEADRKGD